MQCKFQSKKRLKSARAFPDAHRDALREFGPGVCAGHAGRMLGLSGAPDRCVSTAVAAPLDRHAGQELQVAHAKGLYGLPYHRRDVPLAGPSKCNSLPHMSERNRRFIIAWFIAPPQLISPSFYSGLA